MNLFKMILLVKKTWHRKNENFKNSKNFSIFTKTNKNKITKNKYGRCDKSKKAVIEILYYIASKVIVMNNHIYTDNIIFIILSELTN